MWQGTPRVLVAAALPQLAAVPSPTLQDLARRLLLSDAVAPAGQDPVEGPSLAALRIERLVALGEVDGALAVLEALPVTQRTEELDRGHVELLFAKNDIKGACRQMRDGIARYQGVWWNRALIACQALSGDQDQALLGLSLLREQKIPPDAAFDTLIEALGGHPAKLDKLPALDPIRVTLLAAAKQPLPAEASAAADLPTLRAWASNDVVPAVQRLAAAERAAALGALPPAALGDLYGKVEFRPDELGAAIKQGKAPATPRDRALLYAIARTDPAALARAAALQALLNDARKRDSFVVMARLLAPILVDLPPNQDLAGFAPNAVRALYAAGRPEAAVNWLVFADSAAAPTIQPLVHLAQGRPGTGAPDTPLHDVAPKQAALLLTLFTALDEPATPAGWAALIAAPHDASLPSAAVWTDQQQAASAKRIGETVLMTLLLTQAGDRLTAEPIVLGRAISGLKAAGLEADARALAVEAALAAGI